MCIFLKYYFSCVPVFVHKHVHVSLLRGQKMEPDHLDLETQNPVRLLTGVPRPELRSSARALFILNSQDTISLAHRVCILVEVLTLWSLLNWTYKNISLYKKIAQTNKLSPIRKLNKNQLPRPLLTYLETWYTGAK